MNAVVVALSCTGSDVSERNENWDGGEPLKKVSWLLWRQFNQRFHHRQNCITLATM